MGEGGWECGEQGWEYGECGESGWECGENRDGNARNRIEQKKANKKIIKSNFLIFLKLKKKKTKLKLPYIKLET